MNSSFVLIDKKDRHIKIDALSGVLCIFENNTFAKKYLKSLSQDYQRNIEIVERALEFNKLNKRV